MTKKRIVIYSCLGGLLLAALLFVAFDIFVPKQFESPNMNKKEEVEPEPEVIQEPIKEEPDKEDLVKITKLEGSYYSIEHQKAKTAMQDYEKLLSKKDAGIKETTIDNMKISINAEGLLTVNNHVIEGINKKITEFIEISSRDDFLVDIELYLLTEDQQVLYGTIEKTEQTTDMPNVSRQFENVEISDKVTGMFKAQLTNENVCSLYDKVFALTENNKIVAIEYEKASYVDSSNYPVAVVNEGMCIDGVMDFYLNKNYELLNEDRTAIKYKGQNITLNELLVFEKLDQEKDYITSIHIFTDKNNNIYYIDENYNIALYSDKKVKSLNVTEPYDIVSRVNITYEDGTSELIERK